MPKPTPTGPASMTGPRNVVAPAARAAQDQPVTPPSAATAAAAPEPAKPKEDQKTVVANAENPYADATVHPIGWLGYVPTDQIEIGEISLRDAQLDDPKYKQMLASIEKEGIFENLLVTPSETSPGMYLLVNGLQRITCAQTLGLEEVPVKVVPADEAKLHSLQIQSNLHRVDTKPSQFGASIRRMMELNTDLTVVDLADELNVSVKYINERIGLKTLLPEIAEQVDSGEITASAGFALSKLPPEEQPQYVARAVSLPIDQFTSQVSTRVKDIREATKEGRKLAAETFTPIPRRRSKTEIEEEHKKHKVRAELVTEDMTAVAAFDLAIAWTLQMDPASVETEREKWEAERKGREERAAARAANNEKKKKDAAAKEENAAAAAVAAATA